MSQSDLPDDLSAFESLLRQFTPTPATLDLAELMFRAGQAAALAEFSRMESARAEHADGAREPVTRAPSIGAIGRPVSGWWRVATALSLSLAGILATVHAIALRPIPSVAESDLEPSESSSTASCDALADDVNPAGKSGNRSAISGQSMPSAVLADATQSPRRTPRAGSRSVAVRDVQAILSHDNEGGAIPTWRSDATQVAMNASYSAPSSAPSYASGIEQRNVTRHQLLESYLPGFNRLSQ